MSGHDLNRSRGRLETGRIRWIATGLISVLLLTVVGCQEETQSLTEPDVGAELATTLRPVLSFRMISPGVLHTCGVTTSNLAYCWGDNDSGQLGDGTTTDRLTPVAVVGSRRFRQVSTGDGYTCGLTTTNRIFCWGSNGDGQLGDGTTQTRLTPVRSRTPQLDFRAVEAGASHSCAISTDNRAYCWGNNPFGQVGDGTTDLDRRKPVPVAGGLRFLQVSAGFRHTCGVSTNNRAYCWGGNHFYQLGDGTVTEHPIPNQIASGRRFIRISAGSLHSCAVSVEGRAFCWGRGDYGQIGDGSPFLRTTPRAVAGGLLFGQISAGAFHTCAVSTSNRSYCWGRNWNGQLGDGTSISRLVPTSVSGAARFGVLRAGHSHSCGVTPASEGYCWGYNGAGTVGDGTTTDRLTPVLIR